MTRAIWKSALEFVYLDHGPDVAFARPFDSAREAIISKDPVQGWLAIEKDAAMNQEVNLTYWHPMQVNGRDGLPVLMDIFGVRFWTDALRHDLNFDVRAAPAAVNIWTF